MRILRYRLRALMGLVLVSALILGAIVQLSKVNLRDINDLKPRIFLLGLFLMLVLAKLILWFSIQTRRFRSDNTPDPEADGSADRERPWS